MATFNIPEPTAEHLADEMGRGKRVTDGRIMRAIDQCSPPLLDPTMMARLRIELDEHASRRGRPKAGSVSRQDVAAALEQVERDDVPPIFLEGLILRLRSGRKFTEAQRGLAAHREIERLKQGHLISMVYRRIYAALNEGPVVNVPPFGMLEVPQQKWARWELAVEMTRSLLKDIVCHPLPAADRMMNIISENSYRSS